MRRAGMNIDLQAVDFGTIVPPVGPSKEQPSKGGWNVCFTFNDGLFSLDTPATNSASPR